MLLLTRSCATWQNFDAGFGVCGAYTKKLFHCALFVCDILSFYSILKEKRGIYKKIMSLCPAYHKKGDLTGLFFRICPATGKKSKFPGFRGQCGALGKIFYIYTPHSALRSPMSREIIWVSCFDSGLFRLGSFMKDSPKEKKMS